LQEEFYHKTLIREQLLSSSGRREDTRKQKLEALTLSARDNMFGKSGRLGSQRSSRRSHVDLFQSGRKNKPASEAELEFEAGCVAVLEAGDWQKLEAAAVEQLDKAKGKSFFGFFYLGIAL